MVVGKEKCNVLKQAGGGFTASRFGQRKWQIVGGATGIMDELTEIVDGVRHPANEGRRLRGFRGGARTPTPGSASQDPRGLTVLTDSIIRSIC